MRPTLLLLALATAAQAQWTLQPSGTSASLRGIHAVSDQIAWASGTSGTVLHTTDGGVHWLPCATPPAAERLDFRGIQAFDAQTAIVMSSGKGDLSRLYKTTDACQTWTLVFTNPDPEGFWDAIAMNAPTHDGLGKSLDFSHALLEVLGDPVNAEVSLFGSNDGGETWDRRITQKKRTKAFDCKVDAFHAKPGEASFAASNQGLILLAADNLILVTGGSVTRVGHTSTFSLDGELCHESTYLRTLPMAHGNSSSGAFAAAVRWSTKDGNYPSKIVIVGGDYKRPDAIEGNTAILSRIDLFPFVSIPTTPPHGYRSAVAYNPTHKSWITVGPNGTDLSTDDGRNWHPLRPSPGEAPDADRNWNALSLPFVVGPKGRIGRLR